MTIKKESTFSKAAEVILSLFFPRRCPVCQEIVTPKGGLICPGCRKKVTFVEEPVCRKCGREIPFLEQEYCETCRRRPRSFETGRSLLRYDEVGQRTIKAFKYGGRQEYADWYAAEMADRLGGWLAGCRADALIPVPIHRSRLRKRGFNQAEVLARRLSKHLGIPVRKDILRRTKKTEAQKNLGWEGRQKNLMKAVEASPLPAGIRRVILVDDIYTSGATAEACARALLKAGASVVYVATVCIVEE